MEKKQVLEHLLSLIKRRKAVLIIGLEHKDIPTLHNFIPNEAIHKTVKHCGFGVFIGRTPNGEFSFCGGGAMTHYSFGEGDWLSYTVLDVENEKVLQDLGYDFERVRKALNEIIQTL